MGKHRRSSQITPVRKGGYVHHSNHGCTSESVKLKKAIAEAEDAIDILCKDERKFW